MAVGGFPMTVVADQVKTEFKQMVVSTGGNICPIKIQDP
jgi:hypothetical protein